MHQIDTCIGFQQVPPDPLSRMRLARNQQHPQPVAHPVDLHHGGVVSIRQFPLRRGRGKLQHIHPAMRQRDRQIQILAHRHAKGLRRAVIHRNRQIHRAFPRRGPLILDPQRQHHLFAQDGKGRRVLHDQAAVPIRLAPRQQHMQGRGQRGGKLHIMHLPIGDDHRPRHARTRLLGQQFRQRRHRQRSAILGRITEPPHPQFRILQPRHLGLDACNRRLHLPRPVAQALARAFVHHQKHDIRQRRPLLLLQGRIGNRRQHHQRRQPPQPPSRQAPPYRHSQQHGGEPRQPPQHRPRHQRIKDQRSRHCPSLSSSAGTCT